MQFLTKKELRRCAAVVNNKPRELTQTEKVLLAAVEVSKKPVRDLTEIKDLVQLMTEAAGGFRLADKIQDAMANPELMQDILDVYPLVEFNAAIMGKEDFTIYERLYLNQTSYKELESAANTLKDLFAVLEQLPKSVEVFISTPKTEYDILRRLWTKTKERKFLGAILEKSVQDSVKGVFVGSNSCGYPCNRFESHLIRSVLNEKQLYQRVRQQPVVTDFVLSIEGVKEYTYDAFQCLKAVNEKTNSVYYFTI
jgi:hypothetical protein